VYGYPTCADIQTQYFATIAIVMPTQSMMPDPPMIETVIATSTTTTMAMSPTPTGSPLGILI